MKLIVALCLFSSGILSAQTCSTAEPNVIAYGNGIRRTQSQALADLEYLQEKLSLDSSQFTFCLVYDTTYVESESTNLNLVGEIIDAPTQILQAFLQLEAQTPEQFWYWWSNLLAAPPWFNEIEQNVGTEIGTGISSLLQPDIFKEVGIYTTALQHGQHVVVVAHSQGNLYVNQAYNLLFPSTSSPGIKQFNIVAVATPADDVAGGGAHTTLLRDPIYLTGALAEVIVEEVGGIPVLPSLSWNVDNGPYIDGTYDSLPFDVAFHDFTTSYLDGANSWAMIKSQIGSYIPVSSLGTISIYGTLDGSPWSGFVDYNVASMSDTISGTAVPTTNLSLPAGLWSIQNVIGGPAQSSLVGVNPSASQTLAAGLTVAYTLQFKSNPPTAGFTMSSNGQSATDGRTLNLSIPAGSSAANVNFDSSVRSSAANGGSITRWLWKINGVSVSANSLFSHSFPAGTFAVSLTVTDNRGAQSQPVQGTVAVQESTPPVSGSGIYQPGADTLFYLPLDGPNAGAPESCTISNPSQLSYIPNRFGKANSAVHVAGTGSPSDSFTIQCGNTKIAASPSENLTVGYWVQGSVLPSGCSNGCGYIIFYILGMNASNLGCDKFMAMDIGSDGGGYPDACQGGLNGNIGQMKSATSVIDGTWHNIVWVFDHTNKILTLYLDGIQNGTAPLPDPPYVPYSTQYLAGAGNGSFALNGDLDDFWMENRAWNAADVASYFGQVR